ncbi:MAG: single-stranded-DNA-specific exonuclease RecJ [Bacillota bacterium]|nr:single-stranded-DNA-specific exonuclease RecJ [Bacillota bacterium]
MFHNKRWICSYTDRNAVDSLAAEMGISPLIAAVLVNRGIKDAGQGMKYVNPDAQDLIDPFLLPDMEASVDRIMMALDKGERVCVYGDYDVDGITSVAVVVDTLRRLGIDADYYIPNRLDEGYGVNRQALEEIKAAGARLVITVDCGIVSFEEADYAGSIGLDMIITDHHQCHDKLPEAIGVVNPKRADSRYPYQDLAGVGVAYKLCKAVEKRAGIPLEIDKKLDIVALGTVADIVPLTGENRILVDQGLKRFKEELIPGIEALVKVSGLEGQDISTGHISFALAPRINAAGRLAEAYRAVELLTANDRERALELAEELDRENRKRQDIEADIYKQAVEMARDKMDDSVLVMASGDWHPGVIGIVASKITETLNKPCILFCIEGGEARGSGRSIPGLDLYALLADCKHLYTRFGGHKQAAGLSMAEENLEEFTREINRVGRTLLKEIDSRPLIQADGDITGYRLDIEEVRQLKMLEPFGYGNPTPVFIKRDMTVKNTRRVGNTGDHLKLVFADEGQAIEAIAFRWGEEDCPHTGERVEVAFTPQINIWREKEDIQFVVKDIRRTVQNIEFLNRCNNGMDMVAENENTGEKLDPKYFEGAKAIGVKNRNEFFVDVFSRSKGNILATNSFWAARELTTVLSMVDGTRVHFCALEEYDKDKNHLVLFPTSFTGADAFASGLYLCGPYVFPGQLRSISALNAQGKFIVMEDNGNSVEDELSELFPGREVIRLVYSLVGKGTGISKDRLLKGVLGSGVSAIAVMRAVEVLNSLELLCIDGDIVKKAGHSGLKANLNASPPYLRIKKFITLARESFNTIKNHPFKI